MIFMSGSFCTFVEISPNRFTGWYPSLHILFFCTLSNSSGIKNFNLFPYIFYHEYDDIIILKHIKEVIYDI